MDLNYLYGYEYYENEDIFMLQHPFGQNIEYGTGKILKIKNYFFEHSIEHDEGTSGSPIILIGNCKIIGIHKGRYKHDNSNKGIGTFIGELLKEDNNKILEIINDDKNIENIRKEIINKNNNNLNEIILKYKKDSSSCIICAFGMEFININREKFKLFMNDKEIQSDDKISVDQYKKIYRIKICRN